MNTEKAYRDIGAAVVRAFIKSEKYNDKYSTIKVFTQRTKANEGKTAFFLSDEIYPITWWAIADLEMVKKVTQHVRYREREEKLVKEQKRKAKIRTAAFFLRSPK